MSSEYPALHDRLNAEVVELMRQQLTTGEKEVEVMGRTFIILPEVFNAATLQNIVEYLTHSPLKIISEELAVREPGTILDILEIGPGIGHFAVCAASLGPNINVTAVDKCLCKINLRLSHGKVSIGNVCIRTRRQRM